MKSRKIHNLSLKQNEIVTAHFASHNYKISNIFASVKNEIMIYFDSFSFQIQKQRTSISFLSK